MNTDARVAVVILNYNTRLLLDTLLPHLLRTTYPNVEFIVADNASTDGSAELVEQKYRQVSLIRLDQNYGYAGGYNRALATLDHDYFVLLNSDVEVTPGWLEPLVAMAEKDQEIAALQPKILDYYRRNLFEYAGAAGGYMDKLGYPFCRGRMFDILEEDLGQYDSPCDIFWASGAAMFVRATAWRRSGGLDADLFAHMEEIDLCWRLQRLGFRVCSCPQSTVYHMGGGTLSAQSPRKTFLNFRNGLALLLKNYSKKELWRYLPQRLVLDGVAGAKFLLAGRWRHTQAILHAHFNFYSNVSRWRSKRRGEFPPVASLSGVFTGRIVWQFYARGKKKFSDLDQVEDLVVLNKKDRC